MIISHRLKFAFFNIPDSGSESVEMVLRMSGSITKDDLMSEVVGMPHTIPAALFDPFYKKTFDDFMNGPGKDTSPEFAKVASDAGTKTFLKHMTPKQAVEFNFVTEKQLKTYNCFALLRCPYDRQLSAHSRMMGASATPSDFKEAVKTGRLKKNYDENPSFVSQTDYFFIGKKQVCSPLLFEDYDSEVRRCLASIKGRKFKEIPRAGKLFTPNPDYKNSEFYDKDILNSIDTHLSADIKFFAKHTKRKNWRKA